MLKRRSNQVLKVVLAVVLIGAVLPVIGNYLTSLRRQRGLICTEKLQLIEDAKRQMMADSPTVLEFDGLRRYFPESQVPLPWGWPDLNPKNPHYIPASTPCVSIIAVPVLR